MFRKNYRKNMVTLMFELLFGRKTYSKETRDWIEFYKQKFTRFAKTGITDFEILTEKRYYEETLKDFKQVLNINSFNGMRILELGSGHGFQSLLMAYEGATVYLVDRLKICLEYGKLLKKRIEENMGKFKGRVYFVNVDFFSQKFIQKFQNRFEIVHNAGVIEHYRFPIQILKIMKTCLKKHGILLVGVPNFFNPEMILLWKKYGKGSEVYINEKTLKGMLVKLKLKEIKTFKTTYIFPILSINSYLSKILLRTEKYLSRFLGLMIYAKGVKLNHL